MAERTTILVRSAHYAATACLDQCCCLDYWRNHTCLGPWLDRWLVGNYEVSVRNGINGTFVLYFSPTTGKRKSTWRNFTELRKVGLHIWQLRNRRINPHW